ncbi:MAG: hypothetical protein A2Y62_20900 [Candidatus Fischerbacteria bacterium RBG_13_37_8]|uniref:Fibronectin type-III domain-containing protein n=1 Tax=Candidatus Fischerbacteria bacterium RBG_13_37_8 TaxID=1817863 RepID=A0A1F5VEV2_9BACT|nr:MAG: hypothetical protein A2Y62_20900 [Candidatus Fischerbacteria bacterium RBG_13_37_8]
MSKRSFLIVLITIVLAGISFASQKTNDKDLIIVDSKYETILRANDLPYLWRSINYIIVKWDKEQKNIVKNTSIPIQTIAVNVDKTKTFYIFELREDQAIPHEWRNLIRFQKGRDVILEIEISRAEKWMEKGYDGISLQLPEQQWAKQKVLIPFSCGYNALIDDLLSRTSANQWLDWEEKMTGLESVDIGGTNYTVSTRYSPALFNGQINAKAYDFALQQAQSWHYGANIEEDPYTYSAQTWKNLVLTIPGQTAPSDIVIISAHYDDVPSSGNAPGADDNMSGSATLFEAARLLRQFRFQRTIKIIFFTGEEQGLIGSGAYVNDHPTSSILGVVNLDMYAYDSDNDRCFEIHAGTMTSSHDIAYCFEDSMTAYSLNLLNDFLTSSSTGGSDHASFWNKGVGAIEILENSQTNNQPQGCGSTDWNPYYHTSSDTIANFDMPFVYDVSRAGLATIAAMAIPIEACFTTAPVLTATPGLLQVQLDWTAVTGANTYRVYRSTQGCQGQWVELTETASLTYTDTSITGGTTYFYYVEAVHSDGFCVSAMSNCATATPPACTSCAAYQAGSAAITQITGGDADTFPDNCETATTQVTVENIGSGTAVNTQVTVTSAEPFVSITTPMPIDAGDITVGSTANVSFDYDIGPGSNKATCMEAGTFAISVQAQGQTPAADDTFDFTFEVDGTSGDITWEFEPLTGLEGWTVEQGTWVLSSARVNTGGSTRSVHSSQSLNEQCDVMLSPEIIANSTTQLTIPNWYAIEPQSAATWYDRANVHIIDTATSNRTLVNPLSGKLYQTGTFFDWGTACDIFTEAGWAGNNTGNFWGNSVFDLSAFDGQKIQIELKYMTDQLASEEGVYVDDISITDVIAAGCDMQSDTCTPMPILQPYNNQKPTVDDSGSPKAANGIIDTDETVSLVSTMENVGTLIATTVTGVLSTSDPITIDQPNASYPDIDTGAHQSCTSCYSITAPAANRPSVHWDIDVTENISAAGYGPVPYNYTYHIGESFADVNIIYEYFIETIFHNNITSGCTATNFCPNINVSRDQMAKFLCLSMEKSTAGSCTTAACTEFFDDVPATNLFCSFIEAIKNAGITGGCQANPPLYCPSSMTQRDAMAKFVCVAMEVSNPGSCPTSACSGIFDDVTSGNIFCSFIEGLYNAGVVSGCQTSPLLYCPGINVQRLQMAKFLALGFGLNL